MIYFNFEPNPFRSKLVKYRRLSLKQRVEERLRVF